MAKNRFLYSSSNSYTLVIRLNTGWYVSRSIAISGVSTHAMFVPDPHQHSDAKPEDFRGKGEHAVNEDGGEL